MAGNYTVIRRFADNYYSVTQLKHKKPDGHKGIKEPAFIGPEKNLQRFGVSCLPDLRKINQEHEQKLRESLVRSRTRIFEIAMCNNWELFATFTIDPKKYDRYNLENYYKDFSQFIRDLRKKYGLEIKYLLVPEMHKDGAWHMHGLFTGLSCQI